MLVKLSGNTPITVKATRSCAEGMWPSELTQLANFMQTADQVALTLPDQPFARGDRVRQTGH
jgi:hypothetical protein